MRKAALIIATALTMGSSARADPGGWASSDVTVFVGADVGYMLMMSSDWTLDDANGRSVYDMGDGTGWQGSVVVGAEFSRDFALMVEGQYYKADQDYVTEPGSATSKFGSADIGFLGGFVTGHYRLPITGKIRPYVGAGLGLGLLDIDEGDTEMTLAYKAVAGLDVAVGQTSSVYGEYNYVATQPQTIRDGAGSAIEADLNANVFRIGFRQRF